MACLHTHKITGSRTLGRSTGSSGYWPWGTVRATPDYPAQQNCSAELFWLHWYGAEGASFLLFFALWDLWGDGEFWTWLGRLFFSFTWVRLHNFIPFSIFLQHLGSLYFLYGFCIPITNILLPEGYKNGVGPRNHQSSIILRKGWVSFLMVRFCGKKSASKIEQMLRNLYSLICMCTCVYACERVGICGCMRALLHACMYMWP